MKLKSKLLTGVVGVAMVLSMVAVPASAQTTAELTAMINSLLAQIAQLQAQIGGSTTGGSSVMFTTDLTIGSQGADVTALQSWLVSKGFLTMPAGVAMGYFGTLTKNALAAYQASAGITPASGYFGPITRAKVNAMGGTTGGTTTGGTTGSTGITTPGVEGTLTVSSNNSGLVSTVYEGDSMRPILGMDVEAKISDIAIQRVKLNLGTNSKIYTKGYSKLYVTDGSNVLASINLDSSTVVKEGSTYYVTVTGFNYVVPKNSKKQLVIKADVMGSIDSSDRTTLSSIAITLADNGVRGVDGAGIDQYGPSSGSTVSKSVTFSAELAETATLKLSLNNSSPKKTDVVASAGSSENELDKLTVLMLDLKAEKDDVLITDLIVEVDESTSGTATSPTVYLFDGSNELDNTSIVSAADSYAVFSDIDFTVPKDSTKTLTVKVDIRSADGTRTGYTAAASSTDVTAENTKGDSVTVSGSATGYEQGIRNVGAEITLVSKSISASAPQVGGTNAPSTSTLSATFNVKVKAVGGDIVLGTVASTTYPFFEDILGSGGAPSFKVYRNGAVDATISSVATSTAFTIPSSCTTISNQNSCTLSEGNEVSFPITVQILGRKADSAALTSGLYSIQYANANWVAGGNVQTATFMDGEADWRTSDVSFP